MKKIQVRNLEELPFAAEKILEVAGSKGVLAFYGEMGAGKTTLIREICRLLGVEDSVNSPTFAIVNEYRTKDDTAIFHFDFYRIDKTEEAYDFGYEEYIGGDSLCLIEWPERIESILPEGTVKVTIDSDVRGNRTVTVVNN